MSKTTQNLLYWFTHINIGAAFGIVAFLVYSSMQTVFIEPNGYLIKTATANQSQGTRQ
jgi:hypothetical protein